MQLTKAQFIWSVRAERHFVPHRAGVINGAFAAERDVRQALEHGDGAKWPAGGELMELYLMPAAGTANAAVTRAAVIAVLSTAGLQADSESSEPKDDGVTIWRLRFAGADVAVDFHERSGVLTFATVDVSMLDTSLVGDRLCAALEGAGWEVDQDNVG